MTLTEFSRLSCAEAGFVVGPVFQYVHIVSLSLACLGRNLTGIPCRDSRTLQLRERSKKSAIGELEEEPVVHIVLSSPREDELPEELEVRLVDIPCPASEDGIPSADDVDWSSGTQPLKKNEDPNEPIDWVPASNCQFPHAENSESLPTDISMPDIDYVQWLQASNQTQDRFESTFEFSFQSREDLFDVKQVPGIECIGDAASSNSKAAFESILEVAWLLLEHAKSVPLEAEVFWISVLELEHHADSSLALEDAIVTPEEVEVVWTEEPKDAPNHDLVNWMQETAAQSQGNFAICLKADDTSLSVSKGVEWTQESQDTPMYDASVPVDDHDDSVLSLDLHEVTIVWNSTVEDHKGSERLVSEEKEHQTPSALGSDDASDLEITWSSKNQGNYDVSSSVSEAAKQSKLDPKSISVPTARSHPSFHPPCTTYDGECLRTYFTNCQYATSPTTRHYPTNLNTLILNHPSAHDLTPSAGLSQTQFQGLLGHGSAGLVAWIVAHLYGLKIRKDGNEELWAGCGAQRTVPGSWVEVEFEGSPPRFANLFAAWMRDLMVEVLGALHGEGECVGGLETGVEWVEKEEDIEVIDAPGLSIGNEDRDEEYYGMDSPRVIRELEICQDSEDDKVPTRITETHPQGQALVKSFEEPESKPCSPDSCKHAVDLSALIKALPPTWTTTLLQNHEAQRKIILESSAKQAAWFLREEYGFQIYTNGTGRIWAYPSCALVGNITEESLRLQKSLPRPAKKSNWISNFILLAILSSQLGMKQVEPLLAVAECHLIADYSHSSLGLESVGMKRPAPYDFSCYKDEALGTKRQRLINSTTGFNTLIKSPCTPPRLYDNDSGYYPENTEDAQVSLSLAPQDQFEKLRYSLRTVHENLTATHGSSAAHHTGGQHNVSHALAHASILGLKSPSKEESIHILAMHLRNAFPNSNLEGRHDVKALGSDGLVRRFVSTSPAEAVKLFSPEFSSAIPTDEPIINFSNRRSQSTNCCYSSNGHVVLLRLDDERIIHDPNGVVCTYSINVKYSKRFLTSFDRSYTRQLNIGCIVNQTLKPTKHAHINASVRYSEE